MLASIGTAAALTLSSKVGCAYAAETRPSRNPVLGNGGVVHGGIYTRDWDRSMAFYEKGLGFTMILIFGEAPNRNALLDSGDGSGIELSEKLNFKPTFIPDKYLPLRDGTWESVFDLLMARGPISHLALRTTRMDAAFENARPYANKVLLPPYSNPLPTTTGQGTVPTRLCYLEGPGGEWVELLEMAPWK
jgi:catechol 2,3-dioxygenase-like lactoylglutathione lyase family enzyme